MQLLYTLGINWQLMVAQVVNFTILMVVLMYFVYRPILRLIDTRRETIRKSMEDAKEIERQKREIEQFKVSQMQKADQEMSAILEQAKKQADTVRKDAVGKAQAEATAIVEKAKESLQSERQKMLESSRSTLATAAVRLAEKILEREFTKADQDRLLKSLENDLPVLLK